MHQSAAAYSICHVVSANPQSVQLSADLVGVLILSIRVPGEGVQVRPHRLGDIYAGCRSRKTMNEGRRPVVNTECSSTTFDALCAGGVSICARDEITPKGLNE